MDINLKIMNAMKEFADLRGNKEASEFADKCINRINNKIKNESIDTTTQSIVSNKNNRQYISKKKKS